MPKLIPMSLATAGCILGQAPQRAAGTQTAGQNAFQHLPPMPSRQQTPTPVKTPLARPKPLVIHSQARVFQQCAIPLLNVTPDDKAHYTIQTITPPIGQPGAMVYVTTAPTCGDAIGGPVKK